MGIASTRSTVTLWGGPPERELEIYTALKSASNLTVKLTRRGKPIVLTYLIVGRKTTKSLSRRAWQAQMRRAKKLYALHGYDEALELALKLLKQRPRNIHMLRVVVLSACSFGEAAKAKLYYRQLPAKDQAHMRIRCSRMNIDLTK